MAMAAKGSASQMLNSEWLTGRYVQISREIFEYNRRRNYENSLKIKNFHQCSCVSCRPDLTCPIDFGPDDWAVIPWRSRVHVYSLSLQNSTNRAKCAYSQPLSIITI